jgi:tRNA pseudouridine55 synthase
LLPIETALDDIPALALTGPQADRLRHGQAIRILGVDDGTVCAMTSGRPVAIACAEDGEVRPLRVFNI